MKRGREAWSSRDASGVWALIGRYWENNKRWRGVLLPHFMQVDIQRVVG